MVSSELLYIMISCTSDDGHVTILKKCKGFEPYYFIKSFSLDIILLTLMFISLCIDFVFLKQDVYRRGGGGEGGKVA